MSIILQVGKVVGVIALAIFALVIVPVSVYLLMP